MLSLDEFKNELRLKTAASEKTSQDKIIKSCGKSAERLKKSAVKIALGLGKQGHESVAFLKEHASRTNSPAARTLLAAIQSATPQISDQDFKPSSTAVLDAVKGSNPETAPLMAPEVKTAPVVTSETSSGMAEKTAEGSDKLSDLQNWAMNLKEADLHKLSAIWHAACGGSDTMASMAPVTKEAKAKVANKYSMYGYGSQTVKAALDACSEVRQVAGALASESLMAHQNHEGLMGAYQSAIDGGCQASELISSCMPNPSWKGN
jgi:hypothetical protein